MSTENLSVAIASLQEAQQVLEEEHKHIEEHNIDVEAHPDIRELIDKIFDGEAVYFQLTNPCYHSRFTRSAFSY